MSLTNTKTAGEDEDIRSLLKNHHRKIYYVCRLFARSYKEHCDLFTTILTAASRAIQQKKNKKEKYQLFLKACVNMAALHSIATGLSGTERNPAGDYKTPDYKQSMYRLNADLLGVSDYEKIRLFLQTDNVLPGEITDITAFLSPENKESAEKHNKRFLPFIKEKLIWS